MSKYIQLGHVSTGLPLLNQQWIFIDPSSVLASTPAHFKMKIYDSLSDIDKARISFPIMTRETGSYPRFDIEDSIYPIVTASYNLLPNGKVNTDFAGTTDARSMELLAKSASYEKLYLFYSGGIDSTLILTALLKNWSTQDLEKVILIMNEDSISENRLMYDLYIKDKFVVEHSSKFFTGEITLTNNHLYVTGDLGGQVADYENLEDYDNMFPGTYNKSWKDNKDNLISYFASADNKQSAEIAFSMIEESIKKHSVNAETVFDLLWWVSFNWGYDIGLYFLPALYGTLDSTTDTKQFMKDNYFIWFNSIDYQNWAMSSSGIGQKMGSTLFESKIAMKQYIFEFNGDESYFKYKRHESSISKSKQFIPRNPMGMSATYDLYYRKLTR